jgi:hypothetical protein
MTKETVGGTINRIPTRSLADLCAAERSPTGAEFRGNDTGFDPFHRPERTGFRACAATARRNTSPMSRTDDERSSACARPRSRWRAF